MSSARPRTEPPRSPSPPGWCPSSCCSTSSFPTSTAFAVAERLLARHPELKIVLVSSRDRSTYGSRIEASGARGFIAKGELSGAALERLLE